MAFTELGKQVVMDEGIDGATRYVALHLANNTELSGHGYARKAVLASQMAVGVGGVTTLPANLSIYTANDGAAQQAQRVSLYRSLSGNDELMTPEAITDTTDDPLPDAPQNGQTLQLSITFNP